MTKLFSVLALVAAFAAPNAADAEKKTYYDFGSIIQEYKKEQKEAAEKYRAGAEQGDAEAQYNLGGVTSEFSFTEAEKWYRKAAEQGHANAQYKLGQMYDGYASSNDDKHKAEKWYRKAAEQGHAQAQHNLGLMYGKGRGVPQNYKQAIKWFSQSAEQGVADAQLNLGFMYANGQGVPQNSKKAYMWISLAAALGNEIATENRDIVTKILTPAELSEAQEMAERCLADNYKGC